MLDINKVVDLGSRISELRQNVEKMDAVLQKARAELSQAVKDLSEHLYLDPGLDIISLSPKPAPKERRCPSKADRRHRIRKGTKDTWEWIYRGSMYIRAGKDLEFGSIEYERGEQGHGRVIWLTEEEVVMVRLWCKEQEERRLNK